MSKKRLQAGFAFTTVVLLLIVLSIACGGSSEPDLTGRVGEKITTNKFEITISSVTPRYTVGGGFINEKAGEGAVFIVVNFNYKNISKEPVSTFRVPKIKIIDPNNVAYDAAIAASASYATENNFNKKIASDLNPGISQRDAEVFEVSKENWNKSGWKLRIEADKDILVTIK